MGDRDISPPAVLEKAGKLLSLLKTCRQIYTEAIDILYSSNTFVISEPAVMEYLPLALLPQRINAIRTLRFFWLLPNTPFPTPPPEFSGPGREGILKRQKKWRKIWHIISTMAGLRELHVKLPITTEWVTMRREAAEELLEPIKQVTRPDVFILSLPFLAMCEVPHTTVRWILATRNGWENSDPWDDLPNYTLRRVETIQEL